MSRLPGSPDATRALLPAARESYRLIRDTVLRAGVADRRLKELCFAYLAGEPDEAVPLGHAGRERAALEWAHAIAWEAERADDALWARLHALFSEAELVDLGCAIGFELGQQHWRRTIGLPAREDA